jgi:putative ABC transport system permease protein
VPLMPRLASLWRNIVHARRVERDLDDEVRAAFDLLVDEKIATGMRSEDARRAATLEIGRVDIVKEQVRAARVGAGLDTLLQDIRHSLRLFRRAPGFTAVAIMTLAFGIGANAAIFGALKSVLLDPLPYADASRLVHVYGPLSAGTITEIAQRQRSFDNLAAFTPSTSDAVFGGEEGARSARIAWVAPGLFHTLGVSATIGRTFRKEDSTSGLVPLSGGQLAPDTAGVALVTHAAWERLFAGDPDVLGRDVRINGVPRTVIGVLPSDFIGPMGAADFYLAFDLGPVIANPVTVRRAQWLAAVGRLRPGVTYGDAQREVAGIWADLASTYPEDNGSLNVTTKPLRDAMAGDTRTPLVLLMASAAFVLLIACANLAGALLSRSISRHKEFAIRVALGAGRLRLVRQLLTESTILALAGGAAGVLVANAMLSLVRNLAPSVLPAYADLSLDSGAMIVTALIAVCTGLGFGVAPAFAVDRLDAQRILRDATRGMSEGRRSRRLRGALVAAQVALCAGLLAGAALLTRSLWNMTTAPLGFDPAGVLTAAIRLPSHAYPTLQARVQFLEQLTDRLRVLPGVDTVATAESVPTAVLRRVGFTIEGAPPKTVQPFVLFASVSDEYFRTLRIPLRQGRTFDVQDRLGAPRTIVLSEGMARRYWPLGHAIGARIRVGANPSSPLVTIVGIVGDVRNDSARPEAEPMAYMSSRQTAAPFVRVLVRTHGDPLALVRPIAHELAALDRGLPLDQTMTLRAQIGEGFAARRLPVMLMVGFAALTLLLASVGVYGMFASMAVARQQEFGIRMALGSRPGAIVALMLRQGSVWMAIGLAGGVLGIMVVVRLLRNLLYGVQPFDPVALGSALAILVGCATVALLIPVHRATRVDPMVALRTE